MRLGSFGAPRAFVFLACGLGWAGAWVGGCVAYGSTSARQLQPGDPVRAETARLPLALTIDYQGPEGRDLQSTRQVREAALEALAASREFRLAEREEGGHVLALHLASERNERVWLTVLCVLSATLLPAMVTEELELTAELRAPSGQVLGERRLRMQQTSVVELFMVFGMPFAWESKVRGELFRALLLDLLDWAGGLAGARVAPAPAPPG
jgi:hypothetical protein